MKRYYLQRERLENSSSGRYRYRYMVVCSVCNVQRWTTSYPRAEYRCASCAGRQAYKPAKVKRADARTHGDGYVTKQGYHLVFDGTRYVPAQRLAFPGLAAELVVHHIDGDKLNNQLANLVPLTKKAHREAHSSLEQCAYLLIQAGFIEYDRQTNSYSLSRAAKKLAVLNPVNSGEPLTGGAEGNPEPSRPKAGRCNDYPIGEYAGSPVEARDTLTNEDEGEDIVCPVAKAAAALTERARSNESC